MDDKEKKDDKPKRKLRGTLEENKEDNNPTASESLLDYWKSKVRDPRESSFSEIIRSSENRWGELFDTHNDNIFLGGSSSYSKQLDLENEINKLKNDLLKATKGLSAETSDKLSKIQELDALKEKIRAKEKINHILPRVNEVAKRLLLENDSFVKMFDDSKSCEAVVISIDIRRSTELMLKARKPEYFSKFITQLSKKLSDVIVSNFGVFDKFTGDGVLAFFPIEYSGDEAILRALVAAEQCHKVFKDHYNESRECFNIFIKDVGLGIGVDFGSVTLVNSGNELTVVGIPVVYACRMSGAKAGETLLNQGAKEEVCRKHEELVKITEAEIFIKNEGNALAYNVELPISLKRIIEPDWYIEAKKDSIKANKN